MDTEIARMNRALSFTVVEEQGVIVSSELWPSGSGDPSLKLVGRILTQRSFNFDALCSTFIRAANPGKGKDFTRISSDRFLLSFQHRVDMHRILYGGPWNFDNQLLIFSEFGQNDDPLTMDLYFCDFSVGLHGLSGAKLSSNLGHLIGSKLGIVKDVSFVDNSVHSPVSLRLRVSLDVRKPLLRKTKLRSLDGQETIVNFTYERLGNFCYLCGVLGHVDTLCELRYADDFVDPGSPVPYGPWLRAFGSGRPTAGPFNFGRSLSRLRGSNIFGNFSSPAVSTSRVGMPPTIPNVSPQIHVGVGPSTNACPIIEPSLSSESASLPLADLVPVPLEFTIHSSPGPSTPGSLAGASRRGRSATTMPRGRGKRKSPLTSQASYASKRPACASANWCVRYPNAYGFPLPCPYSNHTPVLIILEGQQQLNSGPVHKPFGFEAWWARIPECEQVIQHSWSINVEGAASRVRTSLKGCEVDLWKWSNSLRHSRAAKKELEDEI
ncbi:hypothetical protein Salat_2163100, partial [Sesamum alatum]